MGDVKKANQTPAGAKRSDDKTSDDAKSAEQHPGKFHYNPVNMSEKEAGIKEHDENDSEEKSRDDVDADKPVKRTLP